MTDMETKVFLEEADVKKDFIPDHTENELKCPFCQQELVRHWGMKEPALYCCDNPKCSRGGVATESAWQALIRTRKALDKGMEHITGLNNMIESWLNLINSDLDQETKLRILKSAISAYVENKGGNNEK